MQPDGRDAKELMRTDGVAARAGLVAGRPAHRVCRRSRRRLRHLRRRGARRLARAHHRRWPATRARHHGRPTAASSSRIASPAPAQWDLYAVDPEVRCRRALPLRLTQSPDSEVHPRVSPDGARIVFASDRDNDEGDFDIWVMRLVGARRAGHGARTGDARRRGCAGRTATRRGRPTATASPSTPFATASGPRGSPRSIRPPDRSAPRRCASGRSTPPVLASRRGGIGRVVARRPHARHRRDPGARTGLQRQSRAR